MSIRGLFVTYATRAMPFIAPTMIGALKRCLRLIQHLPDRAVEPHWVHIGPLFEHDPLVREMLPRLTRYDLRGRRARPPAAGPAPRRRGRLGDSPALVLSRAAVVHGVRQLSMRRGMRRLMAELRPDVVVLADNPLGGLLRVAARAARAQGIAVVGLDDYLSPIQPAQLVRSSPDVTAWFLVGLPFDGESGAIGERAAVGPPMLLPSPARAADPVDLTILGYDPQIARLGVEFLARLPRGTRCRLIADRLTVSEPTRRALAAKQSVVTLAPPPSESEYRAYLEATRVVFCKNGFQQIVEALALGVPSVACEVKGGIPWYFVGEALHPFVCFLPPSPALWDRGLGLAADWIHQRPDIPWARTVGTLPHPARAGSELFADFLRRVAAPPARSSPP